METWMQVALTIGGGVGGGYLGVRIAVATLQAEMKFALEALKGLREESQEHSEKLASHEARIYSIEGFPHNADWRR